MKTGAAPHRWLPWLAVAAVVAVGVLTAARWRSEAPRPAVPSPAAVPIAARPIATAPAAQPTADVASVASAAPPPPAPTTLDGTAPDLRRLYDEYADSVDVRARRMAARAFSACIPLFVPASGETPSPEPLIDSLPVNGRAEREQAWRTLFARCQGFAGERAGTIAAMQSRLARDVAAQDPGARANQALVNGDPAEAGRIAADAFAEGDPAAVASLSGLAVRLAQSRDGGSADAQSVQRALAVDAALPLVACDLGLDCSAQSLPAQQLCAVEGVCSGDLPARLAARLGSGGPDRTAIEAQRARLLALLRSGQASSLDDLLPAPDSR